MNIFKISIYSTALKLKKKRSNTGVKGGYWDIFD